MFISHNMANIFRVSHILLLFRSPKGLWNKLAKYEKLVIPQSKYILWTEFFLRFGEICHRLYVVMIYCCDDILLYLIISSWDRKQFVKLVTSFIVMYQVTSRDSFRMSNFHNTFIKIFFEDRNGELNFWFKIFIKCSLSVKKTKSLRKCCLISLFW